MAHFAKVENGLVTEVIVAEQDFIDSLQDKELWIQTSYNTHGGVHPDNKPLRKNYASIGYIYDAVRDAFIPPQPYQSWTLDEETCLWNPPTPLPKLDKENPIFYQWDEQTLSWSPLI